MCHLMRAMFAAVLIAWAGQGAGFAAEPAPADLEKAVRDLGDRKFAVRERAGELLWKAGAAAEAALRRAASGDDPEVAGRAKAILEKFDYGIYPDTPANVLEAIAQYKAGGWNDAIGRLAGMGEPGIRALLGIERSTRDEDVRRRIDSEFDSQQAAFMFVLLAQGNDERIGKRLETGAETGEDYLIKRHAAWLLVRGGLKPRIAQLTADPASGAAVLRQLVHLYRADGDLTNALACAVRLSDTNLILSLRLDLGDWKAVAEYPSGDVKIEKLGFRAAFYRLGGQRVEFGAALKDIRTYADRLSNSNESQYVAEALLLIGRPREALDVLAGTERSNRENESWYVAEALLLNDRFQEAIDYLTRVKSYRRAFELLAQQCRYEEAFRLVDKAREEKDENLPLLELEQAQTLDALGENAEARKIVARVMAAGISTNLQSDETLASVAARVGLVAEAAGLVASELEKLPADKRTERLAVLEGLFPGYGERAEAWLTLLQQSGEKGTQAEHLARLYPYFHGRHAALREFTVLADSATGAVQRLAPAEQGVLWQSLGAAHQLLGAPERAIACERKACDVLTNAASYMLLARVQASASQWREAAESARRANEIAPDAVSLWARGWALMKSGDERGGREAMERADLLAQADAEKRSRMADLMDAWGANTAAVRQLETIVRLGEADAWGVDSVFWRLAEPAFRNGRFAAALSMWEKERLDCLSVHHEFIRTGTYLLIASYCHRASAGIALAEGRIDEAVEHLRAARDMAPFDTGVAIDLMPVFEKAGRKDAADEVFNKTLQFLTELCRRFPRFAGGRNNLAWLTARVRRELPAGLEYARKAVELDPDDAGARDTLAEVLFQLGRRDEAVAEMKKCVEQAPHRPYFQRQLKRMQEGDPASDPSPETE